MVGILIIIVIVVVTVFAVIRLNRLKYNHEHKIITDRDVLENSKPISSALLEKTYRSKDK